MAVFMKMKTAESGSVSTGIDGNGGESDDGVSSRSKTFSQPGQWLQERVGPIGTGCEGRPRFDACTRQQPIRYGLLQTPSDQVPFRPYNTSNALLREEARDPLHKITIELSPSLLTIEDERKAVGRGGEDRPCVLVPNRTADGHELEPPAVSDHGDPAIAYFPRP